MDKQKVLLSVKDLVVKFKVRDRILTAIRGISLDIFEGESIAIVGESGSGKSVFTKTFAGMLEENGIVDEGSIIFNDEELTDIRVLYGSKERRSVEKLYSKLNVFSKQQLGAQYYNEIEALKRGNEERFTLSSDESKALDTEIDSLNYKRVELFNYKQTIDTAKEREELQRVRNQLKEMEEKIDELSAQRQELINNHKLAAEADTRYNEEYGRKLKELEEMYAGACSGEITDEMKRTNMIIAKEILLSVGRYGLMRRVRLTGQLLKVLKEAMKSNVSLDDDELRSDIFDDVISRVKYLSESEEELVGECVLNLAKIRYNSDWTQIRGTKIATVFQDPMTSLNPIVTIGNQIVSIILKHQKCSQVEARARALELMHKVGIPNPEKRFDDYPFQYSGGMRQRIVIAIALSCQPKILICDEPTTALDVTIQAQILRLIKALQKDFHYSIVFITHDLGVVANIADRVAVLYAGQIVELGNVEEVFYNAQHPYTWALLSSLPQLAERDTRLFCISGTPPSLYNNIVGDPFAPRNQYCLTIDTLKEPPMFRVTETHYAKTWLLDPRAPKVERPALIENIHEKLLKAYNIGEYKRDEAK